MLPTRTGQRLSLGLDNNTNRGNDGSDTAAHLNASESPILLVISPWLSQAPPATNPVELTDEAISKACENIIYPDCKQVFSPRHMKAPGSRGRVSSSCLLLTKKIKIGVSRKKLNSSEELSGPEPVNSNLRLGFR